MLAKRIIGTSLMSVAVVCSYVVLHVQAAAQPGAALYTADQAKRGSTEYTKNQCALCHGPDLAGVGQAPSLKGDEFLSKYDGQSISVLFEKIHKTMPATAPGSLSPAQTADLVSFILSSNNYPAGSTELPSDEDGLKKTQLPKPAK